MSVPENYDSQIQHERDEKDHFFAEHPHSPIPQEERQDFDGLSYFPTDPAYRHELALDEHEAKETITVETTQDGVQEYIRWGAFHVAVDGEDLSLQAYRASADEDRFWVPFRDETSGEETYPAGRYLDLEDEHHLGEDRWLLDFNRAYNPSCAYSEAYECPLIPMENWLDVRIEAGEKDYESAPGH